VAARDTSSGSQRASTVTVDRPGFDDFRRQPLQRRQPLTSKASDINRDAVACQR
jgi:hypothetical protein